LELERSPLSQSSQTGLPNRSTRGKFDHVPRKEMVVKNGTDLANWANSLDEKGKVVTTKMKRNIELLFEIATSSEVSFSNDPVVTWSYFCFAGKNSLDD
jgi:hypothetical protein